ncbi:MAG: homocysteine S-methyltransferase family protein [Alphaproteobacteria bacterium]|nr:homocysteine S-methyltransferase family protein [Alphaproteobacteria bacterium]
MSYSKIAGILKSGGTVILDGGTGTELERRGVEMDDNAWCGAATATNLKELHGVHTDYIAAGADIITANTYASNRAMLTAAGLGDKVEEINRAAVETALKARDQSGNPDVVVAGSISHAIPKQLGSPAASADPLPSGDEYTKVFNELAGILKDAGCEMILLEMMFDPVRIRPAVEAALSTGLPVWAGLSSRRGEDGSIKSYLPTEDIPFGEIASMVAEYDIDAMGVMHSPSDVVAESLDIVRQHFDGPLSAYPDSGYFKMPNWIFEDVISPQDLLTFARQWKQSGVQVLGGCCGLSPEHIAAISQLKS